MAAGADCGVGRAPRYIARPPTAAAIPPSRPAAVSSPRGAAVVRAPNEAAARKAAVDAFDMPTHFPPRGAKIPPWRSPAPVMAEQIEESRYDAKGPTEILDPRF